MKKLLPLLLCLCLLAGCTLLPSQKDPREIVLTPYTLPEPSAIRVTLYTPSEDHSRVLAVSQPLVRTDASLYADVMTALLNGTGDYASVFPEEVTCRSILRVQNILFIDLSWQFEKTKDDTETFFICLSVLANTFTQFAGVDFINVTVEGQQLTYPLLPLPVMLLSAYSGTVAEMIAAYNKTLAAHEDAAPEQLSAFYGIIYVPGTDGTLLPVPLSMTARGEDYASALLGTLISRSAALFPEGFLAESQPVCDAFSKTLRVVLTAPASWKAPAGWLAPQAILCTLSCLYSDCLAMSLTVKSEDGTVLFSQEEPSTEYFSLIRSQIPVFMPNSAGTNLQRTTLSLARTPGSDDPASFVRAYLAAINPVFREKDGLVNNVLLRGDTVILDLGKAYFDAYADLPEESEYAVVYSLIVTVCAYADVKKALILEDQQTRSFFTSRIALDQPLLTLPAAYADSLT